MAVAILFPSNESKSLQDSSLKLKDRNNLIAKKKSTWTVRFQMKKTRKNKRLCRVNVRKEKRDPKKGKKATRIEC